jgi:hypothetical protein
LAKSNSSGNQSSQERLNFLQNKEQAAIAAGQTKEAERYRKAIEAINLAIERQNYQLEKSLENVEDLSDSVKSLGAGLGKNNKLFETMNLLSASMQGSMKSIGLFVKELGPDATKFKKETFKTADAYKSLGNVIAVNIKKLKKQQITTSQYNQSVLDGYEDLEEAIDRLESQMDGLTGKSLKSAQAIKRTFENQRDSLEAVAKAAERSKKNLEGMGFALDTLSSTGIPAMDKLGDVITKAAEGGIGLTLAFAALGAALGKIAYDTGLFGDKLKTIAGYDKKLAGIASKIEVINQKIALGMTGGPNFVAQEAAISFGSTMATMAIEFQQASRTALFGDKLGGVGYGAAQLQIAGIAAENIATAMKDATSVMGSNVSGQFGADMAILAARTGQTSEGIASISSTFMILDGVSKETSLNMQEGLRTMAKQADVNLGALMEDVAAASKDALSYQIKSGPALAKAATFAQSLGTKFTDIANAGKNMVLNYKDSIKAEMSLSAMLGKRVDLSQVRALFAAGETEQALAALKAQGLDPSKMNAFQQEQLKSATGGLDLDSLQKIATRTGRTGELGKGNVGKENEIFLNAKQSAESAKMIGQEVASAMADLAKTEKLQGQREKQKQDNILANTFDIKKDMLDVVQLNKKKEIESSGVGYGLAGAGIATALTLLLTKGKGLGKLLGKGSNIFGKTPTTAPIPPSISGSSISSGLKYNSSGRVINAQTGRFAPTGTANAFKSSQSLVQPAGTFAKPGMASSFTNTAKVGLGSKVTSNLASSVKGLGGVISVLGAAYDYKTRKDQGQSTLQAASGAGGGATGALAGAALGSAIVPVIGTIIGGAIGYWAGSSLADELTGANEPQVKAQETIQTELNESQIAQGITDGQLLSDSAYTIELQKEMVAQLGLSTTLLYEIADYNARGLFQSVNIDGKKVMDALASTSRKQFGVARNTMSSTTVR